MDKEEIRHSTGGVSANDKLLNIEEANTNLVYEAVLLAAGSASRFNGSKG
ncbi:hypothetical protein ADIAL_0574 [Alkalibacterium sp. AK22]|nr:hypothetical protein [Alkalibacterium sp. AK22]EXJ23782.1 hypothetical protein ADIAL_0574 [Alkalibacterium sp. AK22]